MKIFTTINEDIHNLFMPPSELKKMTQNRRIDQIAPKHDSEEIEIVAISARDTLRILASLTIEEIDSYLQHHLEEKNFFHTLEDLSKFTIQIEA